LHVGEYKSVQHVIDSCVTKRPDLVSFTSIALTFFIIGNKELKVDINYLPSIPSVLLNNVSKEQ